MIGILMTLGELVLGAFLFVIGLLRHDVSWVIGGAVIFCAGCNDAKYLAEN